MSGGFGCEFRLMGKKPKLQLQQLQQEVTFSFVYIVV